MESRKGQSASWTPLPKELLDKMQEVLTETFPNKRELGNFRVAGGIFTDEICIRIGFLEKGRLHQVNFETSVDYDPEKSKFMDKIYLGFDAGAHFLESYFTAYDTDQLEGLELPRTWELVEFEDNGTVFVRYHAENTELEAEANAILAQAGEKITDASLFNEAENPEDLLDVAVADPDLSGEVMPRPDKLH